MRFSTKLEAALKLIFGTRVAIEFGELSDEDDANCI